MSADNKALDIFDMVADVVLAKQKAWRLEAACRGKNLDDFFPKQNHATIQTTARKLCKSCPVIEDCIEEWKQLPTAMQRHGMWFGTTDKERRQMRELYK
jgi:hypothetical protein